MKNIKKLLNIFYALTLITFFILGCKESKSEIKIESKSTMDIQNKNLETATFGSGCFWCTEAIFERVNGVVKVVSGYSGGTVDNPSYKKKLTEEKIWDKPIVTEITKFEMFYPAEDYHQEYYDNNPNQGYCAYVITPKVEKFEKIFKDKLKK
jgi:peptide methionine sulfoxide reductase MsrA